MFKIRALVFSKKTDEIVKKIYFETDSYVGMVLKIKANLFLKGFKFFKKKHNLSWTIV